MVVAIGCATALADVGTGDKDTDGPSTTQSDAVSNAGHAGTTASDRDVPSALPGGVTTRTTHQASGAVGVRSRIAADTASTTTSVTRSDTTQIDLDTTSGDDPTPPSDSTPTNEAPTPTNEAPTPTNEAPTPTYEAPTPTYEVPVPTSEVPTPTSEVSTPTSEAELPPLEEPTPSVTPPTGVTPAPEDASDPTPSETAEPATLADHGSGSGSGSGSASTGSETAPTSDPTPSAPAPPVATVEYIATPTTVVDIPIVAEMPPLPVTTTAIQTQLMTNVERSPWAAATRSRSSSSPLGILRLLTRTTGSSTTDRTNGISTLLDSARPLRSDGPKFALGTTGAVVGTSSTALPAYTDFDHGLPAGLQTFLRSYGTAIVVMSLSAMLAAALPGLAGIIIPTVAGVHIGYRQAKAVGALRTSGIAQLAASGPIGIVRSGSLVALRTPRRRLPSPATQDRVHEVA